MVHKLVHKYEYLKIFQTVVIKYLTSIMEELPTKFLCTSFFQSLLLVSLQRQQIQTYFQQTTEQEGYFYVPFEYSKEESLLSFAFFLTYPLSFPFCIDESVNNIKQCGTI